MSAKVVTSVGSVSFDAQVWSVSKPLMNSSPTIFIAPEVGRWPWCAGLGRLLHWFGAGKEVIDGSSGKIMADRGEGERRMRG